MHRTILMYGYNNTELLHYVLYPSTNYYNNYNFIIVIDNNNYY